MQFTLDQDKKQSVQNKLFKTKCQCYFDHQVMANRVSGRKTKPFVAWDDKGTCEELETESTETDSALKEQSGLREGPLSRGVAEKRCKWFSDTQEAVDLSMASPFSQDKHSAAPSSKKKRNRVKFQRKKSSCTVHSVLDENHHSDYSWRHAGSSAAACTVRSTVVSVCLPPGCIPSEVIAQVPAKVTYSTPKERSLVPLDKGCEIDPWINNICAETSTLTNSAQTGMIAAPGLSTLTVVHDLEEDIYRGNNILANSVLKTFLENQSVVYRRNAICEELEMIMGFVKINGAKFSLWQLRAELQNIKKFR